jgi:hypothetical protein
MFTVELAEVAVELARVSLLAAMVGKAAYMAPAVAVELIISMIRQAHLPAQVASAVVVQ